MTSTIDTTQPPLSSPLTSTPVRNNFVAAANDINAIQAQLVPVTTTVQGFAPASGGGTLNFLRADGTWQVPPGSGGGLAAIGPYSVLTNNTASTAVPIGQQTLNLGVLGYTDTGIIESLASANATYNQFIIQNTTNGTTASANVVVSNNLSTSSTNFGEFGMNSSGFTGSSSFNLPGAVYLDSTSVDLVLGTTTANAVHFVTNSAATDAGSISSSGVWTIASLTATNTIIGSVNGSAATATTATNATNTAITDDTTTNATMFPTWVTANTGNLPQKVTSTKITLNPSTGTFSATIFAGAGTSLTGTGASFTAGNATKLTTGRTIAMTGDVVWTTPAFDGSGNVTAAGTIQAGVVTLAKIAVAAASSKLVGSGATGSGVSYVEITLGTNLSMSGNTLNAVGGSGSPGGSTTQVQYNNAGSFAGASGLTTTGTNLTITDATAAALSVGLTGATNPALQVDASTASSATGISIKSAAAASGVTINVISSGTNENGTLNLFKGSGTATVNGATLNLNSGGNLNLLSGGSNQVTVGSGGVGFQYSFRGFTAATAYVFSGLSDTNLSASSDCMSFDLNFAQVKTHQTGAQTAQHDIRFRPSTHAYAAASTLTDAYGLTIDGAPIAGANSTVTRTTTLFLGGNAVGAATATSYGLWVLPNTGATTNIAGRFDGSVDMNGNSIINALYQGGANTTAFTATSNTTLTTITGMSVTLVTGGVYNFRAFLDMAASATGGMKIAFGGTATATSYRSNSVTWILNAPTRATNTTYATTGTTEYGVTATTSLLFETDGNIVCNAGGTFAVLFAQNASSASASTVNANSRFTVTRVA